MRLYHLSRSNSGSAAAEMALMLPLLLALLFVCFEGGYFLWNEHKVVKSVRDGARYAGRLSFTNFDCDTGTVKTAAVEKNIKNLTRTGQIADGGTPVVYGWTNSEVTVDVNCETRAGLYELNSSNAPVVTVVATAPYPTSPLTAIAGALGFDVGISLHAQAESAVMGL